ncbi:MAG: APC family permease [Ktedonobacteraceae bacterium]
MSIETASSESSRPLTLRRNAIGLPGVLFQSITTMAPAGAVAFSLGAAIPYAGGALPLTVLIALIVCALIALSISSLARYLPSAGGYLTYVSQSLGSHAGWMTGWLYGFTYLLVVPLVLLIQGQVTDGFMISTFHLSLGTNGWAIWAVVWAIIIFALTYFGVRISADAGIITGMLEIGVFLVLAIWLIVTAGSSNTVATFLPSSSIQQGLGGWVGIMHGMVFTFLAFAGFESCAPLAEETSNPRRNVGRAIFLATLLIGLFFAFCSYAGVVGWGIGKIATYPNDPNPWGTLANRVWGPLSFLAILAILNSGLGNGNAGVNAASRVLYAMGRVKTLPSMLGRTNRHAAPGIAIILTIVLGAIVTLGLGLVYGPSTAFNLDGTLLTLPLLLVYMASCVSVPVFYWRQHREEFRIWRHVLIPAIPFIVLLIVIYFQFVPAPPYPLNLAGPIVAIWFVLGLIIVAVLGQRSPAALARSNDVFTEEA